MKKHALVEIALHLALLIPAMGAASPNIIIIIADDLGYGDTSVYDGWVHTPQLERMASEGLTFTDFHSNSSVCSPTRAAFMTGRYQQRVGIVDVVARHLDTPGLDPAELTLPRLMKQGGYRTALIGKWHLGTDLEIRAMEPRPDPAQVQDHARRDGQGDRPNSRYPEELGYCGKHAAVFYVRQRCHRGGFQQTVPRREVQSL